jgi:RNA polymerase-binding transcription factor DksA
LAQVREALGRIEQGTYGTCVDCTAPIQHARRAARPFALRCVICRQTAEGGRANGAGLGRAPSLAG